MRANTRKNRGKRSGLRKSSRKSGGGLFGFGKPKLMTAAEVETIKKNINYDLQVLLKNSCDTKVCDNCTSSYTRVESYLNKLDTAKVEANVRSDVSMFVDTVSEQLKKYANLKGLPPSINSCKVNPNVLANAKATRNKKARGSRFANVVSGAQALEL